jgi:hypothetical protein
MQIINDRKCTKAVFPFQIYVELPTSSKSIFLPAKEFEFKIFTNGGRQSRRVRATYEWLVTIIV